jgi:hypothetical protein
MSKYWIRHCVGSLAFVCIVQFVPLRKLTLSYILGWLNKVVSVLKWLKYSSKNSFYKRQKALSLMGLCPRGLWLGSKPLDSTGGEAPRSQLKARAPALAMLFASPLWRPCSYGPESGRHDCAYKLVMHFTKWLDCWTLRFKYLRLQL